MDSSSPSYYPLRLGPVTLGLRFSDSANTQAIRDYFDAPDHAHDPDILMDFTLIDHDDYPDIPQSLIQAKQWKDDSFTIADNLFKGRKPAKDQSWEIEVKAIMTKGQITRVFEQFLYQAFYSACARTGSPAFLLHSSGIAVHDKGFLFVGPSGMGKSTIAELSTEFDVINDEMNILRLSENGVYTLYPSPFNAYFKHKAHHEATLKAVFLLRHDSYSHIEKTTAGKAVAEVTGQVVPPLGLEDSFSPAVSARMMSIALELVTNVPVYVLYFPVEGGFWPLIQDLFP